MPIESLYKRIEMNMQKTKSFFDIRLSQALKQSEGDLRASAKTSEDPSAGAIPFELIKSRFLKQNGTKSASRRRVRDLAAAPQSGNEGNVL